MAHRGGGDGAGDGVGVLRGVCAPSFLQGNLVSQIDCPFGQAKMNKIFRAEEAPTFQGRDRCRCWQLVCL